MGNIVVLCMASRSGGCGGYSGGWVEVVSLFSTMASTAAKRSLSKLIHAKKYSGTALVAVVVIVVAVMVWFL